jgi:hypothetical protein
MSIPRDNNNDADELANLSNAVDSMQVDNTGGRQVVWDVPLTISMFNTMVPRSDPSHPHHPDRALHSTSGELPSTSGSSGSLIEVLPGANTVRMALGALMAAGGPLRSASDQDQDHDSDPHVETPTTSWNAYPNPAADSTLPLPSPSNPLLNSDTLASNDGTAVALQADDEEVSLLDPPATRGAHLTPAPGNEGVPPVEPTIPWCRRGIMCHHYAAGTCWFHHALPIYTSHTVAGHPVPILLPAICRRGFTCPRKLSGCRFHHPVSFLVGDYRRPCYYGDRCWHKTTPPLCRFVHGTEPMERNVTSHLPCTDGLLCTTMYTTCRYLHFSSTQLFDRLNLVHSAVRPPFGNTSAESVASNTGPPLPSQAAIDEWYDSAPYPFAETIPVPTTSSTPSTSGDMDAVDAEDNYATRVERDTLRALRLEWYGRAQSDHPAYRYAPY